VQLQVRSQKENFSETAETLELGNLEIGTNWDWFQFGTSLTVPIWQCPFVSI
jgi:hypothetical protein